MPDWFAGVADDLAAEAVRGVRVDVVPVLPAPPRPTLATHLRPTPAEGDRLASRSLAQGVRRARAEQERRDRNTAMLLWGIHL